ncbi:MAG: PP2C family serine/threonine-protein phosphatase [Polyangiaceae bacterium]
MFRTGRTPTHLTVATATHQGLKRKFNLDAYFVTDFEKCLARDPFQGVGPVWGTQGVGLTLISGHLLDWSRGPAAAERSVAQGFKNAWIAAESLLRGLTSEPLPVEETALRNKLIAVMSATASSVGSAALDQRFSDTAASATIAVIQNGRLDIAQAGDTRAFVVRGPVIAELSRGDTLVAPAGLPGSAAPMPVTTVPLGVPHPMPPFCMSTDFAQGDGLILASRGVTTVLPPPQLLKMLYDARDPGLACKNIVDTAIKSRGEHNVTCIIATPAWT